MRSLKGREIAIAMIISVIMIVIIDIIRCLYLSNINILDIFIDMLIQPIVTLIIIKIVNYYNN